jgi:hypothetical protein
MDASTAPRRRPRPPKHPRRMWKTRAGTGTRTGSRRQAQGETRNQDSGSRGETRAPHRKTKNDEENRGIKRSVFIDRENTLEKGQRPGFNPAQPNGLGEWAQWVRGL